jgi:hypothetical protein
MQLKKTTVLGNKNACEASVFELKEALKMASHIKTILVIASHHRFNIGALSPFRVETMPKGAIYGYRVIVCAKSVYKENKNIIKTAHELAQTLQRDEKRHGLDKQRHSQHNRQHA